MTTKKITKTEFATLHDSICSGIRLFEKDLILEFNDGFWVNGFDKHQKYVDTFRSFESKVRIVEYTNLTLTTMDHKKLNWENLMNEVNEGKLRLEFLAEQKEDKETVFKCDILRNNQENEPVYIRLNAKRIVKTFKKADYTRVW